MSIKLKTGLIATMVALFSFVSVIQPLTSVYATSNYSENIAQSTISQTVNFANHTADHSPNSGAELAGQNATCERSIPGIGWIVCQVTRVVFNVLEWLINDVISQGLLRVDLIEEEDGLRTAWAGFKTLSNYIFIIAFIVIIYAEATGRFGFLETYSATKLLPRLAFAAIMTQISFFLVGYLLQIFNSFGDGIGAIILSPVEGFSSFDVGGVFANLIDGDTFFGIPKLGGHALDNIFAGLVAFGAGVGAAAAWPILLTGAALAIGTLVVVLIIRKVLIIALVVTAPLAFSAFVLPGTEKIFRLWWDNLLKVLAMFPIIVGFIASGQLLARLVLASDNLNFIDTVIAMIAAFGPLFLVPYTFRFAGGAIGNVAGFFQKRVENQKDTRNPNSMMSGAKRLSGQNYDRLMTGQAKWGFGKRRSSRSIVPSPLRRAYTRLPWTDVGANSSTSLMDARKTVEQYAATIGDDVWRAMSVTGAGARKGPRVKVKNGDSGDTIANSGWAKQGSNFVYDSNGQIRTDPVTGLAYKADKYGAMMYKINDEGRSVPVFMDAKKDFYSKETMTSVNKLANDKAYMTASAEYTIGKAESVADQLAVIKGINMSKWTEEEKASMRQGVWYNARKDGLHVKFMKANFNNIPNSERVMDINYGPKDKGKALIDFDFAGLAEYVDTHQTQYELMQQKGPFWHAATEGLKHIDTDRLTDEQKRHIENMAWKAQGVLNGVRQYSRQIGENNEEPATFNDTNERILEMAAMGSSAVGEAARNAEKFLSAFAERVKERHFSKIEKPNTYTEEIFDSPPPPPPPPNSP